MSSLNSVHMFLYSCATCLKYSVMFYKFSVTQQSFPDGAHQSSSQT